MALMGGDEDKALADYFEEKIRNPRIEPKPYLNCVRQSPSGNAFSSGLYTHFPLHDLEAACLVDKFPFALEVFRENGLHVLRAVNNLDLNHSNKPSG